ncbi:MAG: hypothetical protein ABSF54_13190 [Bryobacteraceae bacterium]
MATKRQIAANRRNALKSTGPRSENGKAISRFNALRHGLYAKSGVRSPESLNELSQIRRDLLNSFQPQNPEQTRLVEQMASARWQLLNWQHAETQALSDPSRTDPLSQIRIMDGFSQRQARYQRAFAKAFEQFRRSAAP